MAEHHGPFPRQRLQGLSEDQRKTFLAGIAFASNYTMDFDRVKTVYDQLMFVWGIPASDEMRDMCNLVIEEVKRYIA